MMTNGRRALLRAVAALPAIAAAPGASAACAATGAAVTTSAGLGPDPLVALGARFDAVTRRLDAAEARHAVLRGELVRRHGELPGDRPADAVWGRDPTYPAHLRALADCNRLGAEQVAVLGEMLPLRPRSAAGLRAKLRVLCELWPREIGGGDGYYEHVAITTLREAEATLARLAQGPVT